MRLPAGDATYAELPAVSHGYPPPQGRLPTCYAPVRRAAPPKGSALDLHALGTPPALILSQDQTLHQYDAEASQLTPKRRDACASGLPKEPRPPKGAQDSRKSPSLHVMATHESGLLALLWASQSDPDPTTHSPEWALLPASSARSVFGTRQGRPVRSAPVAPPRIRPRRQLVNVLPPFRSPQSLLHSPSPVKGLKWVMPSSAAVAPWPSRAHWPRPSVSQGTSQGYHLANTMSSNWQVVQRETQTGVTSPVSSAGPIIVSPAR